jgi:hypothetical protein
LKRLARFTPVQKIWTYQNILISFAEKVFIRRYIVPDNVMGLPAAKEWKTRSNFKFNSLVEYSESRGGDVADVISVVHIRSCE